MLHRLGSPIPPLCAKYALRVRLLCTFKVPWQLFDRRKHKTNTVTVTGMETEKIYIYTEITLNSSIPIKMMLVTTLTGRKRG